MADLYIQEAVNLMVSDEGDNSKHLNLVSIKLPALEEMVQKHHPGGAMGEISIGGLGIKELAVTFKMVGWDPQTLSQFGLGSTNQVPYTIYGLVRNKNGNAPIEVKAVVKGRLVKADPSDFKRGNLLEHDYAINEILHYELFFNTAEKYYWDFFGSDFRIDGVSQNSDLLTILRIPGSGV